MTPEEKTKKLEALYEFVEAASGDRHPAVVTMAAALFVGPEDQAVAEFTGLPLPDVQRYGTNLRAAGIWGADGKVHANWADETYGATAFNMDSLVAMGIIERIGE